MKRTRVIMGFALLASFGAGIGAGWLIAARRQPPDQTAVPPNEAAAPKVPGDPLGLPPRHPELSGTVEAVEPANEPGFRLLLRSAGSGDLTYVIVRAGVPVDFTVDCSKSGPGDIKVKIESSKRKTVPVSIENNGDDTYTVTYEAKDHGPQTITITLDDEEVPQSPIKLDVKKAIDLSAIKVVDLEPRAFVDCINDFYIDLSALPPADQKAAIECDIRGPDGTPVDTAVSKLPDGTHQVKWLQYLV